MKLENLQRANDLAKMKKETLRQINGNAKTIEALMKPSDYLEHSYIKHDMTEQTENEHDNNKLVIEWYISACFHYSCFFKTETIIKALQEELKRLNARLEEIDKEIESL